MRVLLLALTLTSCARAPAPDESDARGAIERWIEAGAYADAEQVRSFERAARQGCAGVAEARSQVDLAVCERVRVVLAEQDLAAAEAEYLDRIIETSEFAPEGQEVTFQREWEALLSYAQKRWREVRDADCTARAFESAGGMGGGVFVTQCVADETERRAARLREPVGADADALRSPALRPVPRDGASPRGSDRVARADPLPRSVPQGAGSMMAAPPGSVPEQLAERPPPTRPDPRSPTQSDARPTRPNPPSTATRPEPRLTSPRQPHPTESAGAGEGTGQTGAGSSSSGSAPAEAGFQFGNRSFTCPSPPNDGTLTGTVVYTIEFAPNGRFLSGHPRSRDALPPQADQVPQTTTATFRFSVN